MDFAFLDTGAVGAVFGFLFGVAFWGLFIAVLGAVWLASRYFRAVAILIAVLVAASFVGPSAGNLLGPRPLFLASSFGR